MPSKQQFKCSQPATEDHLAVKNVSQWLTREFQFVSLSCDLELFGVLNCANSKLHKIKFQELVAVVIWTLVLICIVICHTLPYLKPHKHAHTIPHTQYTRYLKPSCFQHGTCFLLALWRWGASRCFTKAFARFPWLGRGRRRWWRWRSKSTIYLPPNLSVLTEIGPCWPGLLKGTAGVLFACPTAKIESLAQYLSQLWMPRCALLHRSLSWTP